MAQTSRVTVHCPSCGESVEVPIQVATVQRGPDVLRVGLDQSTARHVCKTQPYVDGAAPVHRPRPAANGAGQLEVSGL